MMLVAFIVAGPAHERGRAATRLRDRGRLGARRRAGLDPHAGTTTEPRPPDLDGRRACQRRPRRRPPRARPRDHADRERRPARRSRWSPPSIRAPATRTRSASPGRPASASRPSISALVRHARARGTGRRRRLGRPFEPLHPGRAARRPDPADRPLPRPRGLHPLDGHARAPRRPGRVDAPGAARARRGREGRRLPRDGRDRAERGRRAVDRRHRRAGADAGLGRLDPGAEGRDHGDPRRDRDQQVGSSAREDDAERGAPGPRARAARRAARPRSFSPRRCAATGSPSSGRRSATTMRGSRPTASWRAGAARTWRARCSRSPACGRGGIWRMQCATTRSCWRCSRPSSAASSTRSPPSVRSSSTCSGSAHDRWQAPSLADIEAAREQVAGRARVTPIYGSETLSRLFGRKTWLKAENLQRTGSFKVRGAVNKLASMSEAERAAGVVAASAGNHGQAVAWAARESGVKATIYMPQDAPMAKVEATQELRRAKPCSPVRASTTRWPRRRRASNGPGRPSCTRSRIGR